MARELTGGGAGEKDVAAAAGAGLSAQYSAVRRASWLAPSGNLSLRPRLYGFRNDGNVNGAERLLLLHLMIIMMVIWKRVYA